MKWFKHDCDMHSDLKVQILIDKHGLEGYGIWNLCLEMVGQEGKKGKIDGQLRWRQLLLKIVGWSEQGKLDNILSTMAEVKLICPKSFKYGNLYIPKFMRRADDYTMRKIRTEYEPSMDNVHVDKKRIEQIRREYINIKNWDEKDLNFSDYARFGKRIKELLIKAKGDCNKIISAMNWVSKQGYADWTLETVLKKWPDFAKRQKVSQVKAQQGQDTIKKLKQMKEESQAKPIDPKALDNLTSNLAKKLEQR